MILRFSVTLQVYTLQGCRGIAFVVSCIADDYISSIIYENGNATHPTNGKSSLKCITDMFKLQGHEFKYIKICTRNTELIADASGDLSSRFVHVVFA